MAAPSGTFSNFLSNFYDPPAISGTNVAFVANYNGGTQSGVFRGSGGPLTTIAASGNVAGGFGSFNDPAIHGEIDREPQGHSFWDHRVDWIEVGDSLPRHSSDAPALAPFKDVKR